MKLYHDDTISLTDSVKNSNMSKKNFLALAQKGAEEHLIHCNKPRTKVWFFLIYKEDLWPVPCAVALLVGHDYCSMLYLPISKMAFCFLAYYRSRTSPLEKYSDRRKLKCLMF